MEEVKPIPIIPEIKQGLENKLKCDICGFIAKSEQGLIVHRIKHKKFG